MTKKNVDDYLTEGIYGTRQTKKAERKKFLGTIRERVVIALTKGQVMSDKGLSELNEAMQANKGAKLLLNGHIGYKFLKEEKALANKYNIEYSVITNENADTNIGAVLTYDFAIDKENIFIEESQESEKDTDKKTTSKESFLAKVKKWFS